jgi:hypothetical protein
MASPSPYGESTDVIHITDLRLFGGGDARGAAPAASAAAVLSAAAAERPSPDAVILTGDLAADRSAEAYALAQRLVRAAFPAPTQVLYLPGCAMPRTAPALHAHCRTRVATLSARGCAARRPGDDAAAAARAFGTDFVSPAPGDAAPLSVPLAGGPPDSTHRWRALLLPAAPAGGLRAATAAALLSELDGPRPLDATTPHVLLVMTAPLAPSVGYGGYDEDTCTAGPRDPDALVAVVNSRSGVRVVLHGGAAVPPAQQARSVGESVMMGTPAACGGDADDPAPGYRILSLIHYDAGSHTSRVVRV